MQLLLAGSAILIALLGVVLGIFYYVRNSGPRRWERTRREFIAARRVLEEARVDLTVSAAVLLPLPIFSDQIPVWVPSGWIPATPLPLESLTLRRAAPATRSPADELRTRLAHYWPLPFDETGTRYSSYHETVERLDKPSLFENRTSYRALEFGGDSTGYTLLLDRTNYFDYLDTSEVLAIELAAARRRRPAGRAIPSRDLKYRHFLAGPLDLKNRCVIPGICTLTIRLEGDSATFFMHLRDQRAVSLAPKVFHVTPAGEFQPSNLDETSFDEDMDVWLNIMREYDEEFLGTEEAYGDSGKHINRSLDEPYRSLDAARSDGSARVYFAGAGLDPLNWKLEILTIVVFQHTVFDALFAEMIKSNKEGLLIVGTGGIGVPFEEKQVLEYSRGNRTLPSAMLLLDLALRHRDFLISTSRHSARLPQR